MHRITRFILNFALRFLLLLVCSLYFLLATHAPMPIGGVIAGARIGQGSSTLYLPGQEFFCTKGSQIDRCQVRLQNHPLDIAITYADSRRDVARCIASYANLTTNCTTSFHSIVVGGWLPVIYIKNNLGLSEMQLQELKRQQLHKRNIVLELSETTLVQLARGIAVAIGCVVAASGWRHFAQLRNRVVKVLITITSGYVAFGLSWILFMLTLLGFGYVD